MHYGYYTCVPIKQWMRTAMTRSKVLQVCVTDAEFEKISKAASNACLTVSSYLRARLFSKPHFAITISPIERHDLYQIGLALKANPLAEEAISELRAVLARL